MARKRTQTGSGRKSTSKASSSRSTAKRSTSKRTAAKRSTTKRTTAKRSTAKRSTAKKKSTAKRSTAKRSAAKKKSTAKRSTSKRSTAKRSTTKRSTTKRAAVAAPPQARGFAARTAQPPKLDSLKDVLEEQLEDLYSAETQLVEALPKVAQAASSMELRQALQHHLEQTRGHVRRLEQIFDETGIGSTSGHCEGMEGLIAEGELIVAARGDGAAKDAALIAAAQRVEHYEIAGYGTARTLADDLGLQNARSLLQETLDEESDADSLLTKLATGGRFGSGINEEASDEE